MEPMAEETITDGAPDGVGSDHDLIRRLRAGQEEAYEEMVRAHGPRMLNVARRFLPQDADAHDALQDAFLSAFRSLDRFQEQSKLSTWLHRIVVNASLMKLRTRRRRPETSIEDLLPRYGDGDRFAQPVAQWAVTYDTAVESREIREFVRRRIDDLPDSYRAILLLRDIEGLSTEETATMLEITTGAVKTRLHRARQALKTLVEPILMGDAI